MSQTQSQPSLVLELTESNFKSLAVDDPTPLLIDFWAEWCGPCRIMKPLFHEAGFQLEGVARVGSVNVDEQPRLAEAFGIRGIPTLALMKDGKVLDAWSGVLPVGEVVERVQSRLGDSK